MNFNIYCESLNVTVTEIKHTFETVLLLTLPFSDNGFHKINTIAYVFIVTDYYYSKESNTAPLVKSSTAYYWMDDSTL